MPWRLMLWNTLDVALRVPPLFALNAVLNGTFLSLLITDDQIVNLGMTFYFVTHLTAVGICLVLVALKTKQLVYAYTLLLTSGILFVSHAFNSNFVTTQLELSKQLSSVSTSVPATDFAFRRSPLLIFRQSPSIFLSTAMVQCALAFCYNSLQHDVLHSFVQTNKASSVQPLQASSYLFFLLPVMLTLLSMPEQFLQYLPFLAGFLASLDFHWALLNNIHQLADFFHIAWVRSWFIIQNFGMQAFAELQWQRLQVPITLRIFWLMRFAYHIAGFLLQLDPQNCDGKTLTCLYLTCGDIANLAKEVLILGCDTYLSLLGMTSVISLLVHYVGDFCIFVTGSSREEDQLMGTMSAILFFVLGLQTGLTGMSPAKRFGRLYCNACLLVMAMLHFVHGMVHPELLAVSASRSFSFKRHARVLSVSAFLIVFPLFMILYLWNNNPIGTWLFAVIAFGIELVFKVLISLIIYSLFMVDAFMVEFWERLDDYIYYVKSVGNTIEFLFGLFLFGNGAWILLFESGGTIRALMMCIHAYFNIWIQAKEGWKLFMKRRTAVAKISQLPMATAAQLNEYADVCAICYHELNSARVTKCRHMFHGVCLRKWLYIQDNCPLCHQMINASEPSESSSAETVQRDGDEHR